MTNWQRWKGIMKAYPFETKRLAKWEPPYIVQPKYDGVRCRAVPLDNGQYILLSSEENIIYSVPHLNEILTRVFRDTSEKLELDGELYCHGMSFEQIVSITSRTVNLHPYYRRIQFHCFDTVSEQPQMHRQLATEGLRDLNYWIVVAPFYLGYNLDDVMRAYDKIISQGYEGIIVRHCEAPYVRKRSTYVMKFKPKKQDTYKILGVKEEYSIDGVPKDSLGALICDSGNGETFDVGTGFTRERRQELWNGRDMLPGMSAIVKYQHLTSGKQVPRFPVFVEVTQ